MCGAEQGRGYRVSARDDSNRTPLHRAAGADKAAFLKLLIENVRFRPHQRKMFRFCL
jgi:ankyrin repeat protein